MEANQNPCTNSISKDAKFVPLRKKKIPFIKNDESSTPKISRNERLLAKNKK